jgi:hypothetical protein
MAADFAVAPFRATHVKQSIAVIFKFLTAGIEKAFLQ